MRLILPALAAAILAAAAMPEGQVFARQGGGGATGGELADADQPPSEAHRVFPPERSREPAPGRPWAYGKGPYYRRPWAYGKGPYYQRPWAYGKGPYYRQGPGRLRPHVVVPRYYVVPRPYFYPPYYGYPAPHLYGRYYGW